MKQKPPDLNPIYLPGALIGTNETFLSYEVFGSRVNNAGLYVCDFTNESPAIVVASLQHVRHDDSALLILQPTAVSWIFVDRVWDDIYNALVEDPSREDT